MLANLLSRANTIDTTRCCWTLTLFLLTKVEVKPSSSSKFSSRAWLTKVEDVEWKSSSLRLEGLLTERLVSIREAIHVVFFSLLGIFQRFIRVDDFHIFVTRPLVPRVHIGVILLCELVISLLDFTRRCIAWNTQDFVGIPLAKGQTESGDQ